VGLGRVGQLGGTSSRYLESWVSLSGGACGGLEWGVLGFVRGSFGRLQCRWLGFAFGLGLLSGPLLIISDLRKEVGVLLGFCSLLGLVESGSSVYCVSVFLVVGFVGCALVLDSLKGLFRTRLAHGAVIPSDLGAAPC